MNRWTAAAAETGNAGAESTEAVSRKGHRADEEAEVGRGSSHQHLVQKIPEELLERIILSTTNQGDLVADPFSGTFSTSRTAMRLGRRAWGCDLNPEVIKWRPTISDYDPDPDIPEQQYDQDYPFYEFMEAGLTEEQLNKASP